MWPGKYSQTLFILKESSVESSPCWFGQILIVCYYIVNISGLIQKFYFLVKVLLNSLQAQKDLEQFFIFQFFVVADFLIFFSVLYNLNWSTFISRVLPSHDIQSNAFLFLCFSIWWQHDIWISEILNFWFSLEQKELLMWNKKNFPWFHKYSLLDLKRKLVEM